MNKNLIILPLVKSDLRTDGIQVVSCPLCGQYCYLTKEAIWESQRHPEALPACTDCGKKRKNRTIRSYYISIA